MTNPKLIRPHSTKNIIYDRTTSWQYYTLPFYKTSCYQRYFMNKCGLTKEKYHINNIYKKPISSQKNLTTITPHATNPLNFKTRAPQEIFHIHQKTSYKKVDILASHTEARHPGHTQKESSTTVLIISNPITDLSFLPFAVRNPLKVYMAGEANRRAH